MKKKYLKPILLSSIIILTTINFIFDSKSITSDDVTLSNILALNTAHAETHCVVCTSEYVWVCYSYGNGQHLYGRYVHDYYTDNLWFC